MMYDEIGTSDVLSGCMSAGGELADKITVAGRFSMRCVDSDGEELWSEEFDNLLTTLAKNLLLDTTLAGSAYTTVGPFMGLISSVGFSAVAAADTMASHAGWNEAQGSTNLPDYTGNRQTAAFSAASAGVKAMSAALNFVITSAGTNTVQGAFMVTNTGAVNTKNSTAGTLFNAGTLAAAQPVISGNTLQVSWSGTLT